MAEIVGVAVSAAADCLPFTLASVVLTLNIVAIFGVKDADHATDKTIQATFVSRLLRSAGCGQLLPAIGVLGLSILAALLTQTSCGLGWRLGCCRGGGRICSRG